MDAFFATLSGRLDLLTWTGLGLFLVLSVTLGWFIPRRTHNRMLQIQSESHALIVKTIHESNAHVVDNLIGQVQAAKDEAAEWKAVSEADRAVAQEVRTQNSMLLEQGQTGIYLTEQIRNAAEKIREDDNRG